MKTIGIIGGIAPESTIEYYRQLVSGYQQRNTSGHYPQIIINSIDMKKMLDLIAAGSLNDVAEYLAEEVRKLAQAGADFAIFASNTPHIVFDMVQQQSDLPLISIVKATCKEIVESGLKRVALFGTKFTMQGGFYDDVLSEQGIEIIKPDTDDQNYIHEKYMGEFVKGVFRENTRMELLNIVNRLRQRDHIEGLILGGTELPFILKKDTITDIHVFDTTEIHIDCVVKLLN